MERIEKLINKYKKTKNKDDRTYILYVLSGHLANMDKKELEKFYDFTSLKSIEEDLIDYSKTLETKLIEAYKKRLGLSLLWSLIIGGFFYWKKILALPGSLLLGLVVLGVNLLLMKYKFLDRIRFNMEKDIRTRASREVIEYLK